jgi:hypothetical protein
VKWLLAGLVLLAPIQACAREGAVKDITPELDAWSRGNGQRVSPTALRLRAGACLDTDRLPAGWKQDANDQLGSLTISAGGTAIAVKPFERDGFDRSFEGVAHDGRIHVTLSGWSRPQDYWGAWLLGSPAGFDKVRSVTPPWPDRKTDLEAYARGGGERAYVDARHYTQCRDYGSDVPMIWCIVVADDEQYSYGVKLDATNRQRLPQVLATLSGAIDAMRGACPKTSSGAVQ